MKKRINFICIALALLIVVIFSMADAAEKSKEEALLAACDQLSNIMNEKDMTELLGMMDKMKTAGLSWNEEITVPISGIIADKTPEQLSIIRGMYSIDMAYAHVFGKSFEKILTARMEVEDKLNFPKDIYKAPKSEINREELTNKTVAMIRQVIEKSKSNPALLNTFVGSFYGSTIESFHIFCELGLSSGITPEFIELLNVRIPHLTMTHKMLAAFSENGELVQLFDVENRMAVISSITDVLNEKLGNFTEDDLKKIRDIVDQVRNPLIAQSK